MRVVRPPIFNLTIYWRSGTLGCWQDLDPHMPCEASDAMSVLFLGSWSVFQKKHSSFRDKDTLTCSFVQSEGFWEKLSGVSLGVSGGAGRSERSGRPEARSRGGEGSRGTRTGLLRSRRGSGCAKGHELGRAPPQPGSRVLTGKRARPGPPECVPPCLTYSQAKGEK